MLGVGWLGEHLPARLTFTIFFLSRLSVELVAACGGRKQINNIPIREIVIKTIGFPCCYLLISSGR